MFALTLLACALVYSISMHEHSLLIIYSIAKTPVHTCILYLNINFM